MGIAPRHDAWKGRTMSYDPKEGLHRCDVRSRPMNPTDSLTPMLKPGEPKLDLPRPRLLGERERARLYSRHQQRPDGAD